MTKNQCSINLWKWNKKLQMSVVTIDESKAPDCVANNEVSSFQPKAITFPAPSSDQKSQKAETAATSCSTIWATVSQQAAGAGRWTLVNTCTIQHTTLHSSPGHTKQNSKGVDELLRKTIFNLKFGYLSHRPQNIHKWIVWLATNQKQRS